MISEIPMMIGQEYALEEGDFELIRKDSQKDELNDVQITPCRAFFQSPFFCQEPLRLYF